MNYCVPVTVFPPPTLSEEEGESKGPGGGRPGKRGIVFCIASPFVVSVGADRALLGFTCVVPFPAPPERNLSHKNVCAHMSVCAHV